MTTKLSSVDLQRLQRAIVCKKQQLNAAAIPGYASERYTALYEKLVMMLKEAEDAEKIPVQVASLAYDEARSKGETSVDAMRIALHALADKLETEPDRDECAVHLRVVADEDEE